MRKTAATVEELFTLPSPTLPSPACCDVEDVMTRNVVTVRRGTSAQALGELLLLHDISGVPVVDDDGVLCGVVSKTDLVRAGVAAGTGDALPVAAGEGFESPVTAEELMNGAAQVVTVGTRLDEVARRMSRGGIHRLPVVDGGGKLVGIVSTTDIVRWLAGLD